MTELTGLTVAEPVGVESDRTNWTNSGRSGVMQVKEGSQSYIVIVNTVLCID